MSGRLSQQSFEPPSIEQIRAELERRYYFEPIREGLQAAVRSYGHIEALNHLTAIMQDASPVVETIIQQRIAQGLIRDASQARKSIAGNGFQGLVAYSLLLLQDAGIVPSGLAITLKPKQHPLIEEYTTIRVGDDVQKPDIDLLIYHREQPLQFPLLIYSMKTSLRERAGQTYRWKLLVDIASSDTCSAIKEKYSLHYSQQCDIRVGFITSNFYDEIMQPQQQGMLKFFDYVYLTKPGAWEPPVSTLSAIVQDLQVLYH